VLIGLLGTVWKIGIEASRYRVFNIYQKDIKKKELTLFQPIYDSPILLTKWKWAGRTNVLVTDSVEDKGFVR
jgi:uncharacterized membrane protein